MTPYTVILRLPDYLDCADNGHGGTAQYHVEAHDPESAFGAAQDIAKAECESDFPSPEDFAVVAVFEGHLQDQHLP